MGRRGSASGHDDRQQLAETSNLKLPYISNYFVPFKNFSFLHNPHEHTPASALNWPVS